MRQHSQVILYMIHSNRAARGDRLLFQISFSYNERCKEMGP